MMFPRSPGDCTDVHQGTEYKNKKYRNRGKDNSLFPAQREFFRVRFLWFQYFLLSKGKRSLTVTVTNLYEKDILIKLFIPVNKDESLVFGIQFSLLTS